MPKLRLGSPLSPQLCCPLGASTQASRSATETEFRPQARCQTEFGNEENLDNGNSGQFLAKVKPVANAKCYEGRYAAIGAPGPWQSAGLFTNSRSMSVNGLTPGTMYTFQFRAIGGSTGYSDWSDPSSHMSL